MIRHGFPCIAVCDGCGGEGDTIEYRNPRTGALSRADLPIDWCLLPIDGDPIHVCPDCVDAEGAALGDRREAFDARRASACRSELPGNGPANGNKHKGSMREHNPGNRGGREGRAESHRRVG